MASAAPNGNGSGTPPMKISVSPPLTSQLACTVVAQTPLGNSAASAAAATATAVNIAPAPVSPLSATNTNTATTRTSSPDTISSGLSSGMPSLASTPVVTPQLRPVTLFANTNPTASTAASSAAASAAPTPTPVATAAPQSSTLLPPSTASATNGLLSAAALADEANDRLFPLSPTVGAKSSTGSAAATPANGSGSASTTPTSSSNGGLSGFLSPPSLSRQRSAVRWVTGLTEPIDKYYKIGEALGSPGQFGEARVAVHKTTRKTYAVKVLVKAKFSTETFTSFRREIDIMKKLDHPNIIAFHAVYEDPANVYIVMDICRGGDLFARITQEPYSEKQASACVRQLLSALAYLHGMNIAHCDLKPDNFLYETKSVDSAIKIIDFGMSKYFKRRTYFSDLVGTILYVSPDVLEGKFNEACDLWSIGVVIFVMLFGYPPFYEDGNDRIMALIKLGFDPTVRDGLGPFFPSDVPISSSAMDLISRLLQRDPAKRLNAEEALNHPWVRGETATDQPLDVLVLKGVKSFTAWPRIKRLVCRLMTDTLSELEIASLKSTFTALDTEKAGCVTFAQLKAGLERAVSTTASRAELAKIMANADLDHEGSLSYDELMLSYVHTKLVSKEERLRACFQKLDTNSDGTVTASELSAVLDTEHKLSSAELDAILRESDANGDGRLDYEDFLTVMWNNTHRPVIESHVHTLERRRSTSPFFVNQTKSMIGRRVSLSGLSTPRTLLTPSVQLSNSTTTGTAAAAATAASSTAGSGSQTLPSALAQAAMQAANNGTPHRLQSSPAHGIMLPFFTGPTTALPPAPAMLIARPISIKSSLSADFKLPPPTTAASASDGAPASAASIGDVKATPASTTAAAVASSDDDAGGASRDLTSRLAAHKPTAAVAAVPPPPSPAAAQAADVKSARPEVISHTPKVLKPSAVQIDHETATTPTPVVGVVGASVKPRSPAFAVSAAEPPVPVQAPTSVAPPSNLIVASLTPHLVIAASKK